MTLFDRDDFTCVICQCEKSMRFDFSANPKNLEPVCFACERTYGATPPKHGAFRDRRIATQIIALAAALDHEAYRQAYPMRW